MSINYQTHIFMQMNMKLYYLQGANRITVKIITAKKYCNCSIIRVRFLNKTLLKYKFNKCNKCKIKVNNFPEEFMKCVIKNVPMMIKIIIKIIPKPSKYYYKIKNIFSDFVQFFNYRQTSFNFVQFLIQIVCNIMIYQTKTEI